MLTAEDKNTLEKIADAFDMLDNANKRKAIIFASAYADGYAAAKGEQEQKVQNDNRED